MGQVWGVCEVGGVGEVWDGACAGGARGEDAGGSIAGRARGRKAWGVSSLFVTLLWALYFDNIYLVFTLYLHCQRMGPAEHAHRSKRERSDLSQIPME